MPIASQTIKSFGSHETGPLGNSSDSRAPAETFRSGTYAKKWLNKTFILY